MAKTADIGQDGNSPKDVGRQLRHVRRKQGLSRSEVARSAGLTRRELAAYERGKQAVPESDLWCLAGSCGVDVGELLPERPPVQVNSDLSLLAVGDSIRYLRSPVEDDELLRQYLAMIYELRNVPPGSVVPLRERDLTALADALGGSPERIEARLVDLVGMSREEAARLRSMILPPRSLGSGPTPELAADDSSVYSSDVFRALSTDEAEPPDDLQVVDFFSTPRAPDPFDEPPAPSYADEAIVAVDPFAAHPPDTPPIAAPPPDPASAPISGLAPTAPEPASWPPEGFVGEPTPPPEPHAAVAWDEPATPDSIVVDAWAVDPASEPFSAEPPADTATGYTEPAPSTVTLPAPLMPEPQVVTPPDAFLAPPAPTADVPVPPAFDAFAPLAEPGAFALPIEPAAVAPVGAPTEALIPPPPPIEAPIEVTIEAPVDESEPVTRVSIVDPFGDEDASRTASPLASITMPSEIAPEDPTAIEWAPDDRDDSANDHAATSGTEFERANSNWRVGGIFPATATADDGALALRRADARWALANLRATADFTIEANVDFSAGAGFGVLFRASVDDSDRVTGYSFDVDPIANGGGYLVRQWVDNRQHWRPIAHAPVTDPAMLYGRHTLSLTMRADQLAVLVDGDPVLSISALSRASIEVGREPCRGDRIGIQAWATTEVTIDSFRVARY
jgi:transcriptional regulator with XRE-family HTH domain